MPSSSAAAGSAAELRESAPREAGHGMRHAQISQRNRAITISLSDPPAIMAGLLQDIIAYSITVNLDDPPRLDSALPLNLRISRGYGTRTRAVLTLRGTLGPQVVQRIAFTIARELRARGGYSVIVVT